MKLQMRGVEVLTIPLMSPCSARSTSAPVNTPLPVPENAPEMLVMSKLPVTEFRRRS